MSSNSLANPPASSSPSTSSFPSFDPSAFINNKVVLATCNLNQWALDFDGNIERIIESIRQAKNIGAKYRLGPELEISGYSCEDHFLEIDTFIHSEQSLALLLNSDITDNILCDIGMPILHKNVRYNCRVFCLNRKIVLIRPKMYLADDGNYRERRYFTSWKPNQTLDSHCLSDCLRNVTNQIVVPFGVAAIATQDTILASEICEELWAPDSPHVSHMLAGVEIIGNGSGSHHQLRKLHSRLSLMKNASAKCGGVYVYANQRGCDGNRLYFDGTSLVCVNGELVAQGSQFSLCDVEVVTAVVDLNDVRSFRNASASIQEQSSTAPRLPIVDLKDFRLANIASASPSLFAPSSSSTSTSSFCSADNFISPTSKPINARLHTPEEECALGPACWIWDYLRRSGASGFLLPLSGGADSASVAAIVRVMCALVADALQKGDKQVQADAERILNKPNVISPAIIDSLTRDAVTVTTVTTSHVSSKALAEQLCNSILHTVYMATGNSSAATNSRARVLSESIGAYHHSINIDIIVSAVLNVFTTISGGRLPKFISQGGSFTEDLALQNIQARLRMVMAYLCAQLLPWLRGRKGFLLVLGSANVDESLRGYMTKYDCSSADINPIGGICKGDLKRMMQWVSTEFDFPVLDEIARAPPTAELRPIAEGEQNDYTQTDEEDMGMSYAELGVFGYLRKVERCGPVTMFLKLMQQWGKTLKPFDIAAKVKRFFYFYSVNRHKMTTLTPSYHAESYSPDDNRFDLRQFLYNVTWSRQFKNIDTLVEQSGHTPSDAPSPSSSTD